MANRPALILKAGINHVRLWKAWSNDVQANQRQNTQLRVTCLNQVHQVHHWLLPSWRLISTCITNTTGRDETTGRSMAELDARWGSQRRPRRGFTGDSLSIAEL